MKFKPVKFKLFKITVLALMVTAAAAAADRVIVIVQGKGERNSARILNWRVCENGVFSPPRSGETFRVPAGRTLVITEAAFYLRGRVNRGARAVRLGITLRQATETLDLAALTARLDAGLGTNIVSRRFSPGLVVPAGAEVRSELKEAEGGSQGLALSVSFYGYYL